VKSQTPGFVQSSIRVFDLSLGDMLWSRRTIFMALVVGLPVLLSLIVRVLFELGAPINRNLASGSTLFGLMIWVFFIRFAVPVLGVFYGTSLIADEVDDKTITYLFTRPIPRGAVLVGKYLAYLACTTLLLLPSVMIVYFLIVPLGGGSIGESFPTLAADLGMIAAGLAGYGAVFALVGARLKRPLVVGLVFAFGWEPGVLLFPGYLKRLTVAYYLQGLVPHTMPNDSTISVLMQIFQEVPTLASSLLALAIITLGTLWLASRTVETREYVLEQ
jgi:ABC-2 type transport system permease protein